MCCLIYYKCFSKVFSRYLSPTFLALISWSFLMLMPHTVESSVLSKVQSMYPFFTLGLLFRTYKIFDIIKRHIVVTLLISTAVFITMYVLFKPDQYFYHFQAMKTSQWLLSYAMTIVAGLAGIMICYLISLKVSQIEKSPIIWLNSVGQYTLAIYLEQTAVFSTINLLGLKLAYVWQIFLMALVIFIGLASVTKLVSRYPRVSIYLLGK